MRTADAADFSNTITQIKTEQYERAVERRQSVVNKANAAANATVEGLPPTDGKPFVEMVDTSRGKAIVIAQRFETLEQANNAANLSSKMLARDGFLGGLEAMTNGMSGQMETILTGMSQNMKTFQDGLNGTNVPQGRPKETEPVNRAEAKVIKADDKYAVVISEGHLSEMTQKKPTILRSLKASTSAIGELGATVRIADDFTSRFPEQGAVPQKDGFKR